MFKRFINKGSSLLQYSIIIALIALALVPVFYVFGRNILSSFNSLYQGLSGQQETLTKNTTPGNTPPSSSPKGTPENPVKNCVNGECIIDFGDYILTGIPDSFDMFIQTQGTSGGTDKVVELLTQIATQLEQEGLTAEASEIMKLANCGHSIATIEKTYEDVQKTCNFDKDCIANQINILEGQDVTHVNSLDNIDLPVILAEYLKDPDLVKNYRPATSINFIESYLSVINNPNIKDSTKGVVDVLSSNIMELANTFHDYSHLTDIQVYDKNKTLQDIDFSSLTNLDSALICASGKGVDAGVECH